MNFYWPHVLWLLFAPAALLAWGWFRRAAVARSIHPKILQAEADARHLSLVSGPARRTGRAQPWLCAGLALAIVALARPQWGRIEEPVFDQSREILLALDLSRSMNAQDVAPSRLDRAKLLIQSLLDRLRGERVGLVVFSGTAFLQSPLSADYEILHEFLPALNTGFMPEGGTNYRDLLETSLDAFSNADADRYLIILSDGEATDDDWRPLIDDLKRKNIRVIGLGVGTSSGAMIPDGAGGFVKDGRGAVVLSKREDATLRELSEKTGGAYADASSWVDLPALLQATVDAGRRGQFHEENRVRFVDRFQWALAPALLCLLISFWLEFPVRPRPREVRLAPPPEGARRKAALQTAAAALAFFCLFASVFSHRLRAADEDTYAAPVADLVGRLAGQKTTSAGNWADLAQTTLTYGQRLQNSQKSVPAGPVRDALAAVDAGEALDRKAADWPQLRRQLAALLKKPPEQKPPPPQPQPQQNQSQQQQEQKQSNQDQKSQPQNSSSDKSQQNQGSQSKQPNQASHPEQSQSSPAQNQPKLGPSAFGSMKPPPAQPPSKPQIADARELQKFGGTPRQKSPEASDPALAVPLEKLDQLKQQDSPALLYELMRGQTKPPADNGKNW
ncbi:MAG TPA: VWA domain-containing protein [Opitutaceae bacterium]|nr:VWA domain-containing protein [Opitutaceae bacterium]